MRIFIFGMAIWTLGVMISVADDDDTVQVEALERASVHEAFAHAVVYDPEPGPLVARIPPAPIEELAPEEQPDGNNVVWIPGYWAWDQERGDFIWISGIWRDIPPERAWVPGYWVTSDEGARWVQGYWGDAGVAQEQVTYVEQTPPPTLEAGPGVAAPGDDFIWVSGYWHWHGNRYVWRPGFWQAVRPSYVWVPSSYFWTPYGYRFVGGYWDYVVDNRGVVYAPVYIAPAYYVTTGWVYRPRTVISFSVFHGPLFIRTGCVRYHYGNYYAPRYASAGLHVSFHFHSHRRGYDPIYSRARYDNRRNRSWEREHRAHYQQRRDNPALAASTTSLVADDASGRRARGQQGDGRPGDRAGRGPRPGGETAGVRTAATNDAVNPAENGRERGDNRRVERRNSVEDGTNPARNPAVARNAATTKEPGEVKDPTAIPVVAAPTEENRREGRDNRREERRTVAENVTAPVRTPVVAPNAAAVERSDIRERVNRTATRPETASLVVAGERAEGATSAAATTRQTTRAAGTLPTARADRERPQQRTTNPGTAQVPRPVWSPTREVRNEPQRPTPRSTNVPRANVTNRTAPPSAAPVVFRNRPQLPEGNRAAAPNHDWRAQRRDAVAPAPARRDAPSAIPRERTSSPVREAVRPASAQPRPEARQRPQNVRPAPSPSAGERRQRPSGDGARAASPANAGLPSMANPEDRRERRR